MLCLQSWTSDDGHRNSPKYVEFNSKNKFEKLVLLVGFIIRMYHNSRPKNVEFNSKYKFEKLVHLVGFIIRTPKQYISKENFGKLLQ